MVDLNITGSCGRDELEIFLAWYPEGAPREVLEAFCLGSGIASDDIGEVLERVARNMARRLPK